MAKHTPEPWEAVDVPAAGWILKARLRAWEEKVLTFFNMPLRPSIHVNISKDGCELVAHLGFEEWCQFPAEGWKDELAANMKLIAAAPEMLKALKYVKRCKLYGPADQARELIDAAIKKAEGE